MTAATRRLRNWPASLRWTAFVAVVLTLLLVFALVASVVIVRTSWPQTDGEIEIPGLDGEVEVLRDEHGIPQIYADSMHDLMLAQGFVHAQDRFYEMDVRRHATAGRLAELFGEDARRHRPRGADARLAPGRRAGADRAPAGDPRPARRLCGGRQRLPRGPVAVGALARVRRARRVRARLHPRGVDGRRLDRLAQGDGVGPEGQPRRGDRAGDVDRRGRGASARSSSSRPIRTTRTRRSSSRAPSSTACSSRTPPRPAPGCRRGRRSARGCRRRWPACSGWSTGCPRCSATGDGIGSNGWVVGGDHTASGAPILANDPHLGISLPGVWSQVGLHCREVTETCPLDVAGFSFSGVPGVVIGHNADIAWGFTNLAARHHRPLRRAGARRPLAARRPQPSARRCARRRSRSATATTSRSRSGRRGTGRCCPTWPATARRSGSATPGPAASYPT